MGGVEGRLKGVYHLGHGWSSFAREDVGRRACIECYPLVPFRQRGQWRLDEVCRGKGTTNKPVALRTRRQVMALQPPPAPGGIVGLLRRLPPDTEPSSPRARRRRKVHRSRFPRRFASGRKSEVHPGEHGHLFLQAYQRRSDARQVIEAPWRPPRLLWGDGALALSVESACHSQGTRYSVRLTPAYYQPPRLLHSGEGGGAGETTPRHFLRPRPVFLDARTGAVSLCRHAPSPMGPICTHPTEGSPMTPPVHRPGRPGWRDLAPACGRPLTPPPRPSRSPETRPTAS